MPGQFQFEYNKEHKHWLFSDLYPDKNTEKFNKRSLNKHLEDVNELNNLIESNIAQYGYPQKISFSNCCKASALILIEHFTALGFYITSKQDKFALCYFDGTKIYLDFTRLIDNKLQTYIQSQLITKKRAYHPSNEFEDEQTPPAKRPKFININKANQFIEKLEEKISEQEYVIEQLQVELQEYRAHEKEQQTYLDKHGMFAGMQADDQDHSYTSLSKLTG